MTLLTMIQGAEDAIGLPRSTAVITATDLTTRTLLSLAQTEGRELLERSPWPETSRSTTFTTVATEVQGTLSALAPGYNYIVNQTMWNRTMTQPVPGPLSAQDWQAKKAWTVTGPYSEFRTQGDNLLFFPAPTAGQTVAFEYQSKNWCQSAGGTEQNAWAADDDTGLLDENLMQLGLIWRFKQRGGFEYAQDYANYEQKVANSMRRQGGKRVLFMGVGPTRSPYGAYVPEGSWNV